MNTPYTSYSAAAAGARRVPGLDFPISRRTDPVSVRPGTRVIVRRLLDTPDDHGHTVTDVIGTLVSTSPLQVRPHSPQGDMGSADDATDAQHTVEIDPRCVVVLKTLSTKPVRNRDIRAVEQAAAAAFPGKTNRMIGGWLARAGDGITERSNSAVPIGPEAATSALPLDEIDAFYREHDLPTQLLVPDRIGRAAENVAGERGPEIIVMTRDLKSTDAPDATNSPATRPPELPAGVEITVTDQPDEDWLSMYHFRGEPLPRHALELLCERIDGTLGFARLTVDGQLAAITRGTITRGGEHTWLGYSAVEVAEDFRRQGLGTLLGRHMLHWGTAGGADGAYLDVISTNVAGRGLYHNLGFGEHHRHRSVRVG